MLAQLALCLLPLALAGPIAKRDTGVLIQSQRDGLCLAYGTPGDGTPVFSTPCASATTWDIDYGSGSILASGTNFALDAGSNPTNHESMKLWTSYPGLYQQTWYYTGTDYIAITGGTQCLDEGDYGNKVQLYTCQSNNINQQWTILAGPSPAPSSTMPSPSSTMPAPSPSASSGSGGGGFNTPRQIHPNGDTSQCLTVQGGSLNVGAPVAISDCFDVSSEYAPLQMWSLEGSGRGPIKIGNGLCLDAGDNPQDFSTIKVWTCYAGLFQQQWFQGGGSLYLAHDNLCLDVKLGSQPMAASPYGSQADVQVYECTQGDTQQVWTY